MESQTDSSSAPRYDGLLLGASVLLLVGGLFGFYYLDGQLNALLRTLLLLAAVGAAVAVAYRTQLGQAVWAVMLGSRTELRKVVWPTRQEALQMTLMIAVVVLIMSLLLWGLDSLLLFAVKALTGRG
ncbi:MAG TPA: preprotein translocase subunit SecE [Nevskiaceae bacterium]|nr:preprotein translocase subunit SecE [Nevskiaceae bacterium]